MRYQYLVMEREYGSGGTQISEQLSKALGIPYYGRQILETVASRYQVPIEQLESYEEKATNSFLYSVYLMSKMDIGQANLASAETSIYVAEQKVIQDFAAAGPGIFIGHCAAQAFKDRKDVLRVFIHADHATRFQRAISEYGILHADADRILKKFDKKRANYYKANTSKDWKDINEYDLLLNSGKLGINGCVELLRKWME